VVTAKTIRNIERTITPPVQNGMGFFFAGSVGSARKFSPVRIAHSRISLLKNLSLIAPQQQEAIFVIWITTHLYALKIGEAYFFGVTLEVIMHQAPCTRLT
jgi:hypothetical protein